MKNVRFTQVVEKSGQPEAYLLLMKPEKDEVFQKALKADRIMTVRGGSGSADHGVVGYEPGAGSQLLLFPRSLQSFVDAKIVGIKYDLLQEEHLPAGSREEKTSRPAKTTARSAAEIFAPAATAKKPDSIPKSAPPAKLARDFAEVLTTFKAEPSRKEPLTPVVKVKLEKSMKAKSPKAENSKVVKFPGAKGVEDPTRKIKAEVRRALKALQEGKQVAAFQILEAIVKS